MECKLFTFFLDNLIAAFKISIHLFVRANQMLGGQPKVLLWLSAWTTYLSNITIQFCHSKVLFKRFLR